jgi:hypothetical protein
MPGLSDFTQQEFMNWLACSRQMTVLPGAVVPTYTSGDFTNAGLWLALFTAAPTSDAGTGGTEVSTSGTNYARQQVGGTLLTSAVGSGSTLTFASVPSWINGATSTATAGFQVRDLTTPANLAASTVIVSTTGTTIVLNNSAASVGSGDRISISAFSASTASTGNPEPNTLPGGISNGGVVTMAQSSGSWGTVVFFALYDAATPGSGNFIAGDYMGAFNWIPFTCTLASPGVITADTTADAPANGSTIVVTQKYGGTLPSLSAGSWTGLLTTAGLSGATFDIAANNTSSIGGGTFRQVTQQIIGNNTTPSFAIGTLKFTAA